MLWHASTRTHDVPIPSVRASDPLEERTQEIARDLLAATRNVPPASQKLWSDQLVAGAMQDDAFKTALFRFIDVFPVLKTPSAIHQHAVEYLATPDIRLPKTLALGLKAGGILKPVFAKTLAHQIESMAHLFIAGRDVPAALPVLRQQYDHHIAFSVDLLGEAVVSHAESDTYRAQYLSALDQLADAAASWPDNPLIDSDSLGPIPRVNLSIKISAFDGHIAPIAHENSIARLIEKLAPLLERAKQRNVLINFDMEHHALKDLTIALFKRCCERFDFHAGIALQAYLQSAEADARDLIAWAKAARRTVTIRLIKGAYWDYESIHADLMNWPPPVWPTKPETDACFERLTELLLQQTPRDPAQPGIKLALGTHNIRSVARAIAILQREKLPPSAIEFQALRGMADELKTVLAQRAWRVREYVPVGEMIPGMAYLVRRLLENTSNLGWLRLGNTPAIPDNQLLASPHEIHETHPATSHPDFLNEPLRDFSSASARDAFHNALQTATVPHIASDSTFEQATTAIAKAAAAFPAWRDRPQSERSAIIRRAAAALRKNRDHLAAVIIRESRKTWAEADADVCEAIDFCEFYAAQALPLMTPQPLDNRVGERNEELCEPRGPTAVIAPWNFSLSIPTGMTVAALVTGNTAILKPAEQTPAITSLLCQILWDAGVPRDVLYFLPAPGETVGAALVRDPRIATIAFTGSKAVGLDIVRAAAETSVSQPFVKRVIAEMGGKNAIIIDDSADFDEAVLAVRHSAFSYAGQKCSACSRLILLDSVHDAFLNRLIESTRSLILGDPLDPATDLAPVIDNAAAEKIQNYIELGKSEATLAYPMEIENRKSKIENLIIPHIFTNVPPTARIAQEEIFGPVLAVFRASSFQHALDLANSLPCKLTGGLFSRTPSHIDLARKHFRVGNLYINRGITGALVSRQPFGGFALSGLGSKAGGKHYLRHFTDPRNTTENTLRRGFAPAPPTT